jgi:ATP-dependent RNA helicase HelY
VRQKKIRESGFGKGPLPRFRGKRKPVAENRRIARLKPEADSRLKAVFAKIGTPRKKPFKPDPFQLQAVAAIEKSDCLVCAPTGSGKTWIAQEAIRRVFKEGGRSWYASPLKALTNSKLVEFSEVFGLDQVGILTGDRKENADAPIIVGTTEILRNQLYDAMFQGMDLNADLVVLDEAHFLGDGDRGVVWEEVMIYLPQRIPLLLLSATIGNAPQIADWLESIRSKACVVIQEKRRPVPLFPLFFHPTGRLLPLLDGTRIDKKVRNYLNKPTPLLRAPARQLPPFADVLTVLRRFELLPAIFFMKSRADCDAALSLCVEGCPRNPEPDAALDRTIDELTEKQPRLRRHRQIGYLRNAAVGAHHGGQLPAWKLVIEKLMTQGLLEAVFATSTVAAGVNFPARSVVFLNSDRYNGRAFVPLDGTEFHQTTGRAGRRGMDRIGFAVLIPGRFMDVRLIAELFNTPPEDVLSQIKVNFSMILNLLLSYSPEQIREIFQKSFATFLNLSYRQPGLHGKLRKKGLRLMSFLPQADCGGPDSVLDLVRRRREITGELVELQKKLKTLGSRLSKLANLQSGRLFLDHRGRLYCAVQPKQKREEPGVLACRVKIGGRSHAKRIKMRWFSPQKVAQILDLVVDLPAVDHSEKVRTLLAEVARKEVPPPLESLSLGEDALRALQPLRDRCDFLRKQLEGLVCRTCDHFKTCHGKTIGVFRQVLDDFASLWDSANAVRMRLWNDFEKHLQFLKEEGFVNPENTLTDDGRWAAKLRLDQPLVIAEGLRKKVLPGSCPELLAALVAPFVHDRDADETLAPSQIPKRFLNAYEAMKKAITPFLDRKIVRGFDARPVTLWPGAIIYAWAKGRSWESLLETTGVSEGDLSMLVLRTAESLRQIASLAQDHPAVAGCAGEAIDIILREPVAAGQ